MTNYERLIEMAKAAGMKGIALEAFKEILSDYGNERQADGWESHAESLSLTERLNEFD